MILVIICLCNSLCTLHRLVLEPNYFSTMALRRHNGGNIYATIGDVYEREEATCGEQLTTCL